jgi:hypothetical protein
LQNLIMRVRPLRPTDRSPRAERRPHVFGRPAEVAPAPPALPAPEPAPGVDHHLLAERRHRASVAPEDTAHYGCSCGFQFQAPVSTSVACPHCGTSQAW